jgi:adenylylsulfate kinase
VPRKRQPGFAVWITGLPASGKSTVASALRKQLNTLRIDVAVLESDALRRNFSLNPQYDDKDRDYFYGSLAFIGHVLTEHAISVIFDATANRRSYRERARQQIPHFIEVFVECPLDVCIERDPKGIYRKAQQGEANHVPGLQTRYEPPLTPAVVVRGDQEDPDSAARRIVELLVNKDYIPAKKYKISPMGEILKLDKSPS